MIAEKRGLERVEKSRPERVRGSEWKSGKDFLGVRMCVAWRALAGAGDEAAEAKKLQFFHRFDALSGQTISRETADNLRSNSRPVGRSNQSTQKTE